MTNRKRGPTLPTRQRKWKPPDQPTSGRPGRCGGPNCRLAAYYFRSHTTEPVARTPAKGRPGSRGNQAARETGRPPTSQEKDPRVTGPERLPAPPRSKLPDRPHTSSRVEDMNETTKQHYTTTTAGTRLSNRRSASSRYEGLNKLTEQRYTDTAPRPSGISRTFPARPDAPGTGRRLGNHPLVGRPHPVQQRRDQ